MLFANSGAMLKNNYEDSKRVFDSEAICMQNAADEMGIELVKVNTNMMTLYGEIERHRANNNEGLKIAAIVYAMRSLFSIYYIASTVGIHEFKFSDYDVGFLHHLQQI